MARPKSTIEQRIVYFESQVDRSGGPDACHVWRAGKNKTGYGRLGRGGHGAPMVLAHRFAWEIAKGPIPDGLGVLHNCPGGDNPACVNVAHLWLGTQAENMADMAAKGRHYSKTKPELVARGDRHGTRTHPESRVYGERSPRTKLTAVQVCEMRRAFDANEATVAQLAETFGMSRTAAYQILRRQRWAHLPS